MTVAYTTTRGVTLEGAVGRVEGAPSTRTGDRSYGRWLVREWLVRSAGVQGSAGHAGFEESSLVALPDRFKRVGWRRRRGAGRSRC
jgi:hypothetical protein